MALFGSCLATHVSNQNQYCHKTSENIRYNGANILQYNSFTGISNYMVLQYNYYSLFMNHPIGSVLEFLPWVYRDAGFEQQLHPCRDLRPIPWIISETLHNNNYIVDWNTMFQANGTGTP